MTLRKLPQNNRRLERITHLIESCIWQTIRRHRTSFSMEILSLKPSKDLKSARISVYSRELNAQELLDFLKSLRIEIQKSIAQHALRYTPVLHFVWDDYAVFLRRLQDAPPATLDDTPPAS